MISDLRREYASRALTEADAHENPLVQFRIWFDEAVKSQLIDVNAMTLATASPDAEPAARIVLLKDLDERGFIFFTHYDSAKGRDLQSNPRAALLFFWAELERQVRVTGAVTRVPRDASEAYFASRPLESRWAAWAAPQSTEIADRDTLVRQFEQVRARYGDAVVPCPPGWGGFHVAAERIEFWQGRPGRLHDRLRYIRQDDGGWTRARLAP